MYPPRKSQEIYARSKVGNHLPYKSIAGSQRETSRSHRLLEDKKSEVGRSEKKSPMMLKFR